MTTQIPTSASDLTSAWMSDVLGRALGVTAVERIGEDEGFTGGGLFRVTLDEGSMVAKLSPEDANLRAMFAAGNAREVQFYQLSARQNVPVPECYFGAFDSETGASALLIEDMGSRRMVSFAAGCGAADAPLVVDALARIHGAFWESDGIADLPVLGLLSEFDFTQMWRAYPDAVSALLPDLELPERFLEFGDAIASDPKAVFAGIMNGPLTVVHRDAQVDNVLFSNDDAILLDWQFMGKGKGVHDVAFFLISSLEPDVRRACEEAMISRYHTALVEQGVCEYTMDVCRSDYLLGAAWRLFITVAATTQLDNSSPHRRDWRRADLKRLLAFCEDHQISPETLNV
jgi:aminoglycoside/choline kinase family phosphotransferase